MPFLEPFFPASCTPKKAFDSFICHGTMVYGRPLLAWPLNQCDAHNFYRLDTDMRTQDISFEEALSLSYYVTLLSEIQNYFLKT